MRAISVQVVALHISLSSRWGSLCGARERFAVLSMF